MKARALIFLFFILPLASCTSPNNTQSIDQVLESSSNSLGNVNLVNDITKQNMQQSAGEEKQAPQDILLGNSDQKAVEEGAEKKMQAGKPTPKSAATKNVTTTDRDTTTLQVQDTTIGTGVEATSGAQVAVHYKGTLTNGKEFDNSFRRGEPIVFTLGAGQVIKGWDIGIEGMKVGGKRHLVIPPQLAYGDTPRDPQTIPPGSTLVFDVELVDVKR